MAEFSSEVLQIGKEHKQFGLGFIILPILRHWYEISANAINALSVNVIVFKFLKVIYKSLLFKGKTSPHTM